MLNLFQHPRRKTPYPRMWHSGSRNKFGMTVFISLLLLLYPAITSAQEGSQPVVHATLVAEHTGIAPGKAFRVGVFLEPKPGWHTYYKDPGDAGLATTLAWTLPQGFSAGEIDWPPFTKDKEGTLNVNIYPGKVLLPVTITPPTDIRGTIPLKVKAEWLVCKDICIPESVELQLMLPVTATPVDSPSAALFKEKANAPPTSSGETPVNLPLILLLAVLGGLVLNLMPCVLPVLSIKALTVVKKSGHEHRAVVRQGIAYTLGILVSFTVIASILIGLRQGGEAIGWGYQMQSPAFVGFLIYLLFMVGLSLSGLFHLPVLLGSVSADESSAKGSFFTGVLATAVATPCTAPFMASAVGVALTLPPVEALLIFEALGLGLALPFLLISFFPALRRFLPKPGLWMETFKELLAFPMYASVIWLLWVLALQTGAGGMVVALSGLLAVVIVIWMKRFFEEGGTHYRLTALLAYALILAVSLPSLSRMEIMSPTVANMERMGKKMGFETVEFSKAALDKLRAEGKPVFIDATAAWCITCQVNARVAINTHRVMDAFKEHNVTLMIADWTRRNDEITEFLSSFGYKGVPLYVFYPAKGEPVVLPQLLTQDIVIEAISK